MKRNLLVAMLILQVAAAAILAVYLLANRDGETPLDALIAATRAEGADKAVDRLGDRVHRAALAACKRDVCIAQKFEGNRARWALASASTGEDVCADFDYPPCTPARVRAELVRVVAFIGHHGCTVERRIKTGTRPGLRVRCGGVLDFVKLEQGATGQRIAPVAEVPAFLPRVFSAAPKSAPGSGAR